MNKKVALSLLSATVISSMAASAFAAPNSGIYMGGSVDRYYALSDLMNLNTQGLAKFNSDLVEAGSKNIVFVDFDKKGAFLEEIFKSNEGLEKVKRDLKQSDFEGVYTQVKPDGTDGATYDPRKDIDPEPAGELKVESVSAINAKQIEVHFGTAVDPNSVLQTGTNGDPVTNITLTPVSGSATLPGALTGSLSDDYKTLTITVANSLQGDYTISVTTSVTDVDSNPFEAYTKVLNVKDTTRPTITGVTYPTNNKATITFSEPINATAAQIASALTAKDASGNVVTFVAGDVTPVADGKSFDLNLTGLTANVDYTLTIIGLQDFAGNIVSPNPVTKTIKYTTTDTTPPTVVSIEALSNKSFSIKFSEELVAAPTVSVTNGVVSSVVKDSTDPTKYIVTLNAAVSGLQTVSLNGTGDYTDKSGNNGAAYTKVVNFDVDSSDPTVASTRVEKINGKEYLVVTFNENVNPVDGATLVGSFVKDGITTDVTLEAEVSGGVTGTNIAVPVSLYNPVSGKSNALKFDLSNLTAGDYTVDLAAGLATDLNGNNSVAKSGVMFTRGSNTAVGKPALDTTVDTGAGSQGGNTVDGNGIVVNLTDNNKLSVYFNTKVDVASALNKANYSVEGATIANAVLRSNSTTGAQVELTLTTDSNTFTGLRTVTVSGVKSEGGAVMDPVTTSEYLVENVRPTVTKAELTSVTSTPTPTTVITLTFSEAMNAGTITDVGADFDVYIGGAKYTGTVTEAGSANSYTLTLDTALTSAQLTSGVVIKPASTVDAKDANGNALNFTQIGLSQ